MDGFEQAFGFPAEVHAEAPGRVNLLGEHTDYNDGFVLPIAIPQTTSIALAQSRDESFRFHSAQLATCVNYLDSASPPHGFGRYLYGCIETLRSKGHRIPPVTIHVDSRVPIGVGLSSSAALEVATMRALRARFSLNLDDIELARAAQDAEINFTGVRCGIMDQMAASLGVPGHMLFIDTQTLQRSLIPLPDAQLMVFDSGISRSLSATAYNVRRSECEQAAKLLAVRSLRDIQDSPPVLELREPLHRRVRHVLTENARVLRAIETSSAGGLGELMNASHASLRDDFQVSVPPLDLLVQLLQERGDVFGARLTGAGFGGACVALVHSGRATVVEREVLDQYALAGYRGSRVV